MKNFEKDFSRLEKISDTIKQPELTLEETLSLFEEGIQLARALEAQLESAERKIEILINPPEDDTETPSLKSFHQ